MVLLKKKQTVGHEPNHLCFLGPFKGFVFFYCIIIDYFWQRSTSLQINPRFWVALLIHIKMSRKHFPLWCSYCLLSEAIPSEERNYFAYPWFLDFEHYKTPSVDDSGQFGLSPLQGSQQVQVFSVTHSFFIYFLVCMHNCSTAKASTTWCSISWLYPDFYRPHTKQAACSNILPQNSGWTFTCIHRSAKNTMAFQQSFTQSWHCTCGPIQRVLK